MTWEKKGLIYCPNGQKDWAQHSFMTPTPIQLNDNIIRIYGGMRDSEGVSRIGYVDVNSDNPSDIISVSEKPTLDIGKPGNFDDNGVILGDVIRYKDEIRMYYVGFQLVKKIKFLAFSGLAISHNNGESFIRHSQVPVMDRTNTGLSIRAIHSVRYEDGLFKIWYSMGKGMGWQLIEDHPYPAYNIWYTESEDGINFSSIDNTICIDTEDSEYRIGRPRVYKTDKGYEMYYTRDFIERNYIAGYAESIDGKNWIRKDNNLGIDKSEKGWDSQMCCYPVILKTKTKTFMFYNGNNYGETGVGYAELIKP